MTMFNSTENVHMEYVMLLLPVLVLVAWLLLLTPMLTQLNHCHLETNLVLSRRGLYSF